MTTCFGATYTFIPSASTTPTPSGTANWNLGSSWVNAAGNTTGVIPGSADTVGSATSATTVVDSLVPTINELRWANAPNNTSVATLNSASILATGDATLQLSTNGTLNVRATNGTANGNAIFGRASPSGGHLIMDGGTLSTGSTATITNDQPANLIIGDSSSASGAASSTFAITTGTANVGNNLIVGNSFTSAVSHASGTVTQSGGTINVVGAIILGSSGSANYTMTGGTLNQAGVNSDGALLGRDAFFVGRNANASAMFAQSGTAAVSIANGLYIANNSNTVGSYVASGGTLSITGELKVGASTNSTGVSNSSNNVGMFKIVGNVMPTITANRLIANTANSTLAFTIQSDAGTSLLSIVPGVATDGSAVLAASTKLDVDNSSFMPGANAIFELIRATRFNVLPTIVADGDAFDSYRVGILDDGAAQSLVVAPFAASVWTGETTNAWSGTGNWMGDVPSASRDIATFSEVASVAAHQVHLTSNVVIAKLNIVDSGNSYTIDGTSTLTFDSGASGMAAFVNVPSGVHTIAVPVVLNSDFIVSSAAGSPKFTGTLAANGKTLTKTGAGSATFRSLNGVGQLIVEEGTLGVAAAAASNSTVGASKIQSLTVAAEAALDLGNNALVIDYSGPVGSKVTDLREYLRTGRLIASSQDGLVLGFNDNALRTSPFAIVAGLTVDASSIICLRTVAGDSNLDQRVNFDDLISLAQNYNATNRVWAQGDFNYDGTTNFDDLIILAQHYNSTSAAGAQVAADFGSSFAADFALARSLVPEPAAGGMIAAICLSSCLRRRA